MVSCSCVSRFVEDFVSFVSSLGEDYVLEGTDLVVRGRGMVFRLVPLSFFTGSCMFAGGDKPEDKGVGSETGSRFLKEGKLPLLARNNVPDGFSMAFVYEDYWYRCHDTAMARVAAHLGHYRQVFARKCTVERCDSVTAGDFLDRYHSYGSASARYYYILRYQDSIVAAAAFSSPRSIPRKIAGDSGEVAVKIMRSYEWVRYASLPDLRISGGMGRLFRAFVRDVAPDDVMSYADLEWSDGDVYAKLGFVEAGYRKPVDFAVNFSTYSRVPLKYAANDAEYASNLRNSVVIRNLGSKKYLWTNPEKTSGTVLVEKNFGIW